MKKQSQFHTIDVEVAVGSSKTKIHVQLKVDLWGLIQGSAWSMTDAAQHELVNLVLGKLKVRPGKGELQKLLTAHRRFHGK